MLHAECSTIYLKLLFQAHTWRFTPFDVKQHNVKAVLHTSFDPPAHGEGEIVCSPKRTRNIVKVVGSGIAAEMKVLYHSVSSINAGGGVEVYV